MSRDYRHLKVWELSHQMTKEIYNVTQKFPKQEIFGLISQMRRASISIPANIAEGSGRKNKREYIQFLSTALASCSELSYYLYLSKDLNYIQPIEYKSLESTCSAIGKMLNALIKRIEISKD